MAVDQTLNQFDDLKRTMLPERPKRMHGWVLLAGDIVALALSWLIANLIYFQIPIYTTYTGPEHIGVVEIFSVERFAAIIALLFMFRQAGHYKDHIHYFFQLRSIFIGCCFGLIGESVLRLYFESPNSTFGLFIAWGLIVVSVMAIRALTSNLITSNAQFRQPILVLSDGVLGEHTRQAVNRKPRLGYREVDPTLFDRSAWIEAANGALSSDHDTGLPKFKGLLQSCPDDMLLLFAIDDFRQTNIPDAIKRLETLKRPFGFITRQAGMRLPGFKEFPFFGEDLILLLPDKQGPSLPSRIVKRTFDILVSLVALTFLLPFFGLLAIVARKDGGPVFYSQERIGRNGARFKCLKFRTMVVDAEDRLQSLLDNDAEARQVWETHQKIANDPRITPTGRWLRKGSLDELPQLINVLKGEMSIVGPRPCFDDQVAGYGRRFSSYLAMRPGITGLWQVSGRNQTTFEERAELEAWYADNWSLWLDLFILVKTIPVVLLARGAH